MGVHPADQSGDSKDVNSPAHGCSKWHAVWLGGGERRDRTCSSVGTWDTPGRVGCIWVDLKVRFCIAAEGGLLDEPHFLSLLHICRSGLQQRSAARLTAAGMTGPQEESLSWRKPKHRSLRRLCLIQSSSPTLGSTWSIPQAGGGPVAQES